MQDQLSRFTHRTNKEQEGQQVRRVPIAPQEVKLGFSQMRRIIKDDVELDAVGQHVETEDTECETKVTNAVHNESFHRSSVCRRFFVVETDQQVGCDAHAFPAKEHLNEVVRGNQHEHGEGKERQIGKEPCLIVFVMTPVFVMRHVAHGIEVHE